MKYVCIVRQIKTENCGIYTQKFRLVCRWYEIFWCAYNMQFLHTYHLPHNPKPIHCVSYACQSQFMHINNTSNRNINLCFFEWSFWDPLPAHCPWTRKIIPGCSLQRMDYKQLLNMRYPNLNQILNYQEHMQNIFKKTDDSDSVSLTCLIASSSLP